MRDLRRGWLQRVECSMRTYTHVRVVRWHVAPQAHRCYQLALSVDANFAQTHSNLAVIYTVQARARPQPLTFEQRCHCVRCAARPLRLRTRSTRRRLAAVGTAVVVSRSPGSNRRSAPPYQFSVTQRTPRRRV